MKKIIALAFATATVGGVAAQGGFTDGGAVARMINFKSTDMAAFSQYDYTLGTARSAAMSGAFTSLGADLASMSINPAGLGMYRSSEFGVSVATSFNNITSSRLGDIDNIKGNKTRFNLGNIGVAFNLYQGSGALTSMTLGLGYNRLVDFNQMNSFGMMPDLHSIVDIYALQLSGVNPDLLGSSAKPFNNDYIATEDWGAILGYQTSMFDPERVGNRDVYTVNALHTDAKASHYAKFDTRGYLGEYNIAGGFNFSNLLYMGFSLGIQDIFYQSKVSYEEAYSNNMPASGSSANPAQYLDFIAYDQSLKMTGTGVNFKFGLTAQPVHGLKIGVAVHTPTYVSIDRNYAAGMYTQFYPEPGKSPGTGDRTTPDLTFNPKYTSPARLLTGISYTFGSVAIISTDYERVWYNGMRMKDDNDDVNAEFKEQMNNDFRAQNNLRVGLEVRPMPSVALRAGYSTSGSILSDNSLVFNAPVVCKQQGFSFGAGYKTGGFSIDLAYSFKKSNYTEYDLFYFQGQNNANNPVTIEVGNITQKMAFHNIALSMGFRF